MAYHLQAWRENRIFSFFCWTTRWLPQNSFFRFKNGLIPLDTILDQDKNVQLVSCIFSSAWLQSKINLKRQKANLGHARNGWNRRIFVYFFSSFVWKIKSASGCRIVQDFTRLRAVPADLSSPLARVWRLHLTKSKRTCQNHRKKWTSIFWLRAKPIIIVKLKKRYAFQTKLLKLYQYNYWRAEINFILMISCSSNVAFILLTKSLFAM